MPIEKWSETVAVVRLSDGPPFAEDLVSLEQTLAQRRLDSVLDFSGVDYINSSDIARLLKVRQQVVTAEGRLVLCGISTRIWSTFLVTGLDKVFEFSDNVPTALATLQLTT